MAAPRPRDIPLLIYLSPAALSTQASKHGVSFQTMLFRIGEHFPYSLCVIAAYIYIYVSGCGFNESFPIKNLPGPTVASY